MLRTIRFYFKHLFILSVLTFIAYWAWLDRQTVSRFDKQKWALPARVYAAPLEIFAGAPIAREELIKNLELLGYTQSSAAARAGQFSIEGGRVELVSRGFEFPDAKEPARRLSVQFDDNQVQRLRLIGSTDSIALARLEPLEIAVIHPGVFEDRVLVSIDNVRRIFVERLIAVEDKRFFEHPGVDAIGVARAFLANILARKMRQGGSTITQQLIKNLYLSRERSLSRKMREALMALSLERRFSKTEILQAYLNEIYLGQDGNRAVHGFGLGADFYFGKPLNELNLAEQALLIGIIKGPSAYNPRRKPEAAKNRRNVVLDLLLRDGLINAEQHAQAHASPLGVRAKAGGKYKPYAAFVDLVHQNLLKDYEASELQSKGLRIFSTLNPLMQANVFNGQKAFFAELSAADKKTSESLQIASVWADPANAEIKAISGGRNQQVGYNRALLARRQIGSLVKPFIVAEALSRPETFHLGTLLSDEPIELTDERGQVWAPKNYDRTTHGSVTMLDALAKSYNLATVDLGLKLGVNSVVARLKKMGASSENIRPYPSLFLGAVEMTPLEVAQLYHTIANQGFFTPLKAIRTVVNAEGEPLREVSTNVTAALNPKAAYLSMYALTEVVNQGTGRALRRLLPNVSPLGGKTGTSDETRDSWFAGIGANLLGIVWVGADDAKSTGLTGASGALRAWAKIADNLRMSSLVLQRPLGVETLFFDANDGRVFGAPCGDAIALPAITEYLVANKECSTELVDESDEIETLWNSVKQWFKNE